MIIALGDLIMDIVTRLPGPIAYGSDLPGEISSRPGGSVANFAVWAARMGQQVTFVGRVGDDPFGSYLGDDLRREGVTPSITIDPAAPTGTIIVLVDAEGERSMVTDRGANLNVNSEDIPARLVESSDWLHLSGYSLFAGGSHHQAAVSAMLRAKSAGVRFSVDPASSALLEVFGPDNFLNATAGAALLVPNRAEAAVLVAAETPEGMVSELLQHYPMVALKLGAHGCCVGSRDEGVCIVQGTPALPLDSTGAGDAFAAALVCGLLSGKGLAESANVANRLAARVVGVVGARPRLLSQGQM